MPLNKLHKTLLNSDNLMFRLECIKETHVDERPSADSDSGQDNQHVDMVILNLLTPCNRVSGAETLLQMLAGTAMMVIKPLLALAPNRQ